MFGNTVRRRWFELTKSGLNLSFIIKLIMLKSFALLASSAAAVALMIVEKPVYYKDAYEVPYSTSFRGVS